ncbi:hypothetical protein PSACC_00016 [Paramicrosporidium saccamoebae]|uniref:Uncharacterized protein n=1 Tax=Paramicrosporidium saccamoebae TaxID=1246581 RepID=A0A2H9TQY4_9FUNG|nr:hypothetical protein PSACC_00016 [Paramicrosporidium saccamoebae]
MARSVGASGFGFLEGTDDSWWTGVPAELISAESTSESPLEADSRSISFIMGKTRIERTIDVSPWDERERTRSAPKPRAKQIVPALPQVANRNIRAVGVNSNRGRSQFKTNRPSVITKWALGDSTKSSFHFEEVVVVGAEPKMTDQGLRLKMERFVCETTLKTITIQFDRDNSGDPATAFKGLRVALQKDTDSGLFKIATKSSKRSPVDACIFRSFSGKYRTVIDIDDSEMLQNGDIVIIGPTESTGMFHAKEFSSSDSLINIVSRLLKQVEWVMAAKIAVRPERDALPEPKPVAIAENQTIEWIEAKIHELFENSRKK